ncbi:uncharacterized protein LOC141660875 [Apium graveolens]|uniref:uncharacterized protein LOC141660875 n=1 Tax=Apium graveolens TaxID=4045 RepID=UPI003D7A0413
MDNCKPMDGGHLRADKNHYVDNGIVVRTVNQRRGYVCMIRFGIAGLAGESELPWCVLGDFNDLMFAHEKKGGRPHPRRLLEGFVDAVNDCGLIDMGFSGNEFTWERARGQTNWIQERLDRGLANQQWQSLFPDAKIRVWDVSSSDHLPLILELNRQVYVQKSCRFKFENIWIREADCYNLINQSCNMQEGLGIMEKIKYCTMKLQEWGGGQLKELGVQIKQSKGRLHRLRSRRDMYGVRQYNEERDKYLRLLEKREIYWSQRAKQFWLKHGDQNSRFFHSFATGRRQQNQLKGLRNKDGEWKDDETEMQNIVVDYFTGLFKATPDIESLTEREAVMHVTEGQNEELIKPILREEVKEAIFSMHPEKSPGEDGLNPAFYQTYWNIVGDDVFKFCVDFFETGELY